MTIDPSDAKFNQRPPMLAVDGNGYVWRVFEEHGEAYWSMCPVDSGNQPSPEPITYYVPVESESATLLAAALAGDGREPNAHLFEEQESVEKARERLQQTMGGMA